MSKSSVWAHKTLDNWLSFVYDERDNFFFLCSVHRFNVTRPCDGVLESKLAETMPCDYPKCKSLSQIEYFPNLYPEFNGYTSVRQKNAPIHHKRTS